MTWNRNQGTESEGQSDILIEDKERVIYSQRQGSQESAWGIRYKVEEFRFFRLNA